MSEQLTVATPISVEKALDGAFYKLLTEEPFYAYIVVQMERRFVTDINPVGFAAVAIDNGKMLLFINRQTWPLLTLKERVAILKHEVMHLVLDHIPRRVHRRADLWGIAIDTAINWQIDGLPSDERVEEILSPLMTPEQLALVHLSGGFGVMYPERFDMPNDMTAEWYYSRLLEDMREAPMSGGGDDKGEGNGRFWDGHGIWDEFDNTPPEMMQSVIRQVVVDAYQRLTRNQGVVPGNLKSIIEEWLKPSVNWKQQLRQFVAQVTSSKRSYTWKRPSRRFPDMQGTRKEYELNLLVAGDSSASVSDKEYAQFWAEIKRIHAMGNVNITYMEVDTKIQRLEKFTRSTKAVVHGRGGTDLRPPFEWAAKQRRQDRPDAVIYFTDTEGPYPKEQTIPTLWVVPESAWEYAQNHIKWGRMIRLKVEE